MELSCYLSLGISELITETLVHNGTLILGETLALVSHHLLDIQALQI